MQVLYIEIELVKLSAATAIICPCKFSVNLSRQLNKAQPGAKAETLERTIESCVNFGKIYGSDH